MVKEALRSLKSLLSEERQLVSDWVHLVPAVQ